MAQAAGVSRQFVKAAMSAPFLDRVEERSLAVRWRKADDEGALHQLAHAHMRLVIAVAMRFRHYGLPVADLVQEGHVGLLEAAARFEPEREVRFSTYATWWIRASMQDYILRNWSIVRTGTTAAQKSLFFNLRRLRARPHAAADAADREVVGRRGGRRRGGGENGRCCDQSQTKRHFPNPQLSSRFRGTRRPGPINAGSNCKAQALTPRFSWEDRVYGSRSSAARKPG